MGSPLFLKASAGSGKTYRLVLEYLKLLLQDPRQYRNILAVTFTNDATAEMKARILNELEKLKNGQPKSMAGDLVEIGDSATLSLRAQEALSFILHDYSHFAIMTIDSFFQLVLRSFARELQLPIGYSIQLDNDAVLEFAIQSLLSKIGSEQKLTDWLCDYAKANLQEGKSWNIESQVVAISVELFKEISRHREWGNEPLAQEKLTALQTALGKIKFTFESTMTGLGKAGIDITARFGINSSDVSGGYLLKYFSRIQEGDYDPKKILGAVFFEGASLWKKSADSAVKEKIQACLDAGLQDILNRIAGMLEQDWVAYISASQALKHIYNLGILGWVKQYIKDFRKEENALMISDTLQILEALICEENTPFIYEKIGVRFRHVLMDEFQDTSRLQWNSFLPLLLHLLSQGGNVLMVGDAKQSIYRWRGGDMNLLLRTAPDDLAVFQPRMESLEFNYRSRENIVTFNNHFFRWLTDFMNPVSRGTLSPVYEGFEQRLPEKSRDSYGYVEARFFTGEEETEASARTTAIRALPELIAEVVSRGYLRSDICLLVRDSKLAQETAAHLVSCGISVVTPQSLLLSSDQRILLLVAALRLLVDPDIRLNQVSFLQQYAIVHELPTLQEEIFMLDNPAGMEIVEAIIRDLPELQPLPLGELNERLVSRLLTGAGADAFLMEWQDRVQQFITDGNARVESFLEWWEENREKIMVNTPESPDAVKIMTIHKSKGLQFGVVILPFVNWSVGPKSDQLLWVNADEPPYNEVPYLPVSCVRALENSFFAEEYAAERAATLVDNINLLYVACTRAVDELYIFCPMQKMEDKGSPDSLTNAGHFFSAALTGGVKIGNGQYNEDRYFLGEITLAGERETLPENSECPAYLSSSLDEKIALRSFRKEEATHRGKEWHALLAEITKRENILVAVNNYFARYPVQEMDAPQLAQKLHDILATEQQLIPWQQYSLLTERSLVWNGKFLRPDKVYISGSSAIIIDYKTGAEKNSYLEQMQQYRDALNACGYSVAGANLIYTDTLAVVPV